MSTSNTAQAHLENVDAAIGHEHPDDGYEPALGTEADSIWQNLAVAASAQCSIWRMKFRRYAVVWLLGIPMLWASLALGIYGFMLLDRSVAEMLAPAMPAWVSPLLRGLVYFGVAGCVIGTVWNSFVGKSLLDEE